MALVVDASAMVDLLVGSELAPSIADRMRGEELHVPAHFDAEVLSALGRLHRAGDLSAQQVATRLDRLAESPVQRHESPALLRGAWRRRNKLWLVDALYVELAVQLEASVVTTDSGMAAADPRAELIRA